MHVWAGAQSTAPGSTAPGSTAPGGAAADKEAVLPTVRAVAQTPEQEPSKDSLRATTTRLGKGQQALRDLPQSATVITERLLDDRKLATLKEALKVSSGVSFQAAEGGEEDIRLRGFSLQAGGDIFIDGLRDPAFYERDAFNWDRLEVLRGSASMLFGRGSTGGVVNQVSKRPGTEALSEFSVGYGSGDMVRLTGDWAGQPQDKLTVRVTAMAHTANREGVRIKKAGLAPTALWQLTPQDQLSAGLYYLNNDNGIHYGLPWLTPGVSGGNGLWTTQPSDYYGMASDANQTGTSQAHAAHEHQWAGGGDWKTQVRLARYGRDQRASAIRFAAAALQPGAQAVNSDNFGERTVLTRGNNNKVMNLSTAVAQSDLNVPVVAWGLKHRLSTGVDLSRERFVNEGASAPAGVSLVKPNTTVGSPNDGARLDESLRVLAATRRYQAQAVGAYAQDVVSLNGQWKLLGGLRADRVGGRYETVAAQGAATNPCSVAAGTVLERADTLFSRRMGVLFQPNAWASLHASYGTSFNTSGDTYQFDAGTANTPPESSRNIEVGGQVDGLDGKLSTRFAIFHSTKYNERNRDADSVNACNYVLSGQRHAAGLELDVAGRLSADWEVFVSYAFIPNARVDASSGAAGTEPVGSRPGLTPRHSGSLWTTHRLGKRWRAGLGFTARSSDKPVGLAANSNIAAPHFVSTDVMLETLQGAWAFKANVTNVTNAHYADTLYRAHYVPGKPRTVQLSASYRFE